MGEQAADRPEALRTSPTFDLFRSPKQPRTDGFSSTVSFKAFGLRHRCGYAKIETRLFPAVSVADVIGGCQSDER